MNRLGSGAANHGKTLVAMDRRRLRFDFAKQLMGGPPCPPCSFHLSLGERLEGPRFAVSAQLESRGEHPQNATGCAFDRHALHFVSRLVSCRSSDSLAFVQNQNWICAVSIRTLRFSAAAATMLAAYALFRAVAEPPPRRVDPD